MFLVFFSGTNNSGGVPPSPRESNAYVYICDMHVIIDI